MRASARGGIDCVVSCAKQVAPPDWAFYKASELRIHLHCRSKYGSTLKYLEHIGFGPDDQARLQRSLLEG